MTSAAALVVAFPLFRRLHQTGSRTRLGLATVGAVAAAAIIATGLYRLWGNPAGLAVNAPSIDMAAAAAHPGAAAGNADAAPIGSVEAATLKLAERLNAKGGTSADWLLLAQGYEFMGRAEDAKQARDRAGAAPNSAAASSAAPPNSTAPAPAAPPVVSAEGNRLLAEAEKYRVARDYPHAVDAYKRLVRMHAMTADAWANYADAVASGNGGKLSGAPGDFLAEALRLDPDHPKALWLEASMLHEQHRYPEAVGVWQHLASILPAGSSDAKIIAANIDEAQRLSGAAAPPTAAQDAARPATNQRRGGYRPGAAFKSVALIDAVRIREGRGLPGTAAGGGAHRRRSVARKIFARRFTGDDAAAQVVGFPTRDRRSTHLAERPAHGSARRSAGQQRRPGSEERQTDPRRDPRCNRLKGRAGTIRTATHHGAANHHHRLLG